MAQTTAPHLGPVPTTPECSPPPHSCPNHPRMCCHIHTAPMGPQVAGLGCTHHGPQALASSGTSCPCPTWACPPHNGCWLLLLARPPRGQSGAPTGAPLVAVAPPLHAQWWRWGAQGQGPPSKPPPCGLGTARGQHRLWWQGAPHPGRHLPPAAQGPCVCYCQLRLARGACCCPPPGPHWRQRRWGASTRLLLTHGGRGQTNKRCLVIWEKSSFCFRACFWLKNVNEFVSLPQNNVELFAVGGRTPTAKLCNSMEFTPRR